MAYFEDSSRLGLGNVVCSTPIIFIWYEVKLKCQQTTHLVDMGHWDLHGTFEAGPCYVCNVIEMRGCWRYLDEIEIHTEVMGKTNFLGDIGSKFGSCINQNLLIVKGSNEIYEEDR